MTDAELKRLAKLQGYDEDAEAESQVTRTDITHAIAGATAIMEHAYAIGLVGERLADVTAALCALFHTGADRKAEDRFISMTVECRQTLAQAEARKKARGGK
jgi:hypothetical protein